VQPATPRSRSYAENGRDEVRAREVPPVSFAQDVFSRAKYIPHETQRYHCTLATGPVEQHAIFSPNHVSLNLLRGSVFQRLLEG
jgi:hypothetical protein